MAGAPILVVDDTPVNLKLMRLMLTHAGYDVRTAERAEDALDMLATYRPELILADIQLPGMDGLDMTRQVKGDPRTSTIKVVALTACAMKEDRDRALAAGCDDYISKPIDTTTLAARVEELLTRPATPAEPAQGSLDLESMRRQFLEESCTRTGSMLESLDLEFDAEQAARSFHRWVGSAGLLGYSEIASLARTAEKLAQAIPVPPGKMRAVLEDLQEALAHLTHSLDPAAPDYSDAAAGKRIALVGFSSLAADKMCEMLERVKARPRLFDMTDEPASQAIRDCDLVMFHVRPSTLRSAWVQPGASIPPSMKLVFAGEQRDLAAIPAPVRAAATDFLVGGTGPEEILMRIAFALSRSLPAQAEPVPVPTVPVRARRTITCPRVILADDDGIVHALVGATLQNHGMSCRCALNGKEALEIIRTERPDAAVLDVNMPGLDGFGVLAAIRAEKIATRVILLTSLGDERDVLRAFDLGADDYLTKPFNPFELVARLKRVL